jgi:hypothetical protein
MFAENNARIGVVVESLKCFFEKNRILDAGLILLIPIFWG